MARRGRPSRSWKEVVHEPLTRPWSDEDDAKYREAVEWSQARAAAAPAKRGPGRPRKPETERDLKMQEACYHVRWMLEMKIDDPCLWAEVREWLLKTRLSASSIWEEELHADDWAKVSGPEPDFCQPVQRKILDDLVQRQLISEEEKINIVLHLAAHFAGLDGPDDIEALRQYREKGSTTERRRRARGE